MAEAFVSNPALYPLEGVAICWIINACAVQSEANRDLGLSGSMEIERERAIVRVQERRLSGSSWAEESTEGRPSCSISDQMYIV